MSRRGQQPDEGFTLVELLVYASLFVVVLVIVGGILINSTSAERRVRGVTEATNLSQIVARSVEAGVRNSVALKLTSTTDYQLLVVKTPGRQKNIAWSCEAWYYAEASDTLYTKIADALIGTPTPAGLSSWMQLGSGITPYAAPRIFTAAGATGVDLTFQVGAGESDPVSIQTSAHSRGVPPDATVNGLACF